METPGEFHFNKHLTHESEDTSGRPDTLTQTLQSTFEPTWWYIVHWTQKSLIFFYSCVHHIATKKSD